MNCASLRAKRKIWYSTRLAWGQAKRKRSNNGEVMCLLKRALAIFGQPELFSLLRRGAGHGSLVIMRQRNVALQRAWRPSRENLNSHRLFKPYGLEPRQTK